MWCECVCVREEKKMSKECSDSTEERRSEEFRARVREDVQRIVREELTSGAPPRSSPREPRASPRSSPRGADSNAQRSGCRLSHAMVYVRRGGEWLPRRLRSTCGIRCVHRPAALSFMVALSFA